ncbi:MAG: maleylpyruvate isomerase family mycothiol-dependent enzyme [Ilumatobacteraceae bacterium]
MGSVAIDASVPSCPEWHVADLIRHVGMFHRFITNLARLADGAVAGPECWTAAVDEVNSLAPDADLVTWFHAGGNQLVTALQNAPAGTTIQSFYGKHQPSLLVRRSATETAIHRWDVEGASGTSGPLNPALSAEGIDEFLDLLMPLFFRYADFAGRGEVIRLQPTDDVGGAWMITMDADTTNWSRQVEDAPADAAVRASLNNLYLFFLGRHTDESMQVTGDTAMLSEGRRVLAPLVSPRLLTCGRKNRQPSTTSVIDRRITDGIAMTRRCRSVRPPTSAGWVVRYAPSGAVFIVGCQDSSRPTGAPSLTGRVRGTAVLR